MSDATEEEEVALRLLHTADWHLGRRFVGFDEADRPKLTRARLAVVDRILSVAETHQVDAVLCAGDLFDEPTREYWQGLASLLAKRVWGNRPVFLLPGNHDPITPSSVWNSSHPFRGLLPPWVHVIDHEGFEYELSDEAVLYSNPCQSQAGEMDLAMRLPDREAGDEPIRVGMVHGSTFDMDGHQTNFPIKIDAAVQRGLDYLAIGDTHAHRQVPPDAPVPTVYPSTPEQLTFGESDTGYVALVFFRRHGRRPIIRKERVAHWTWRTEAISDLDSLRALRDTQDLRSTVLRLSVNMRLEPKDYEEAERILADLKGSEARHGRVGVLQLRREALVLDTSGIEAAFEQLPEVIQAAVRELQQEERGENAEVARQALYHLYRLTRPGV